MAYNAASDNIDDSDAISELIFQGRGGSLALGDNPVIHPGYDLDNVDDFDDLEEEFIQLNDKGFEKILPEHACSYCGIQDISSVVKCVTCNKWFCNSSAGSTSSHIVNHLVRARHKAVALHPNSELGDTTLECYNCGTKNVFVLGFISAKADTVVVILCRHPCASAPAGKDMNWDTAQWEPIITDRAFIPWLVSVPSEDELSRARKVSPGEMMKLEDLWKNNPYATIEDIDDPNINQEVPQVLLRYDNGYEYQRCFGPLVLLEAEYDRKQTESQSQGNIIVSWDYGLSQRFTASFYTHSFDNPSVRIMIGDEMNIRYEGDEGPPWEGSGFIVKIPNNVSEEVVLELTPGSEPPTLLTTNFRVDFVWSGITYSRIQKSLKLFAADEYSVSGYIYHKLLGHEVQPITNDLPIPQDLRVPGLAELNDSQKAAVTSVLKSPLSLIQGPPGTGKTVVSTTIVYHIKNCTQEPVLVCAPSNVAADQLAERLDQTGLKVVRLVAKSRELISSEKIKSLTLGSKVFEDKSVNPALVKLQQLKNDTGELSVKDRNSYDRLLRKAEMRFLKDAEVVVCTCSAAGDGRLKDMRFRTVLIDESTQATEPECLIPVVHGCKQLVLVGDHQQLGPVIGYKPAATAGLSKSLFERLVILGHNPIRLNVQYRMHPCLSEFPSNMFYDGSLQNGVTRQQRERAELAFPWPVPENPMMFWSVIGQEEISSSGTSYLNRAEATNVEKLVTKFFKTGVKPSQIGIITPYEGQRAYLTQYMISTGSMDKEFYRQVEIESVDAFQGREKDYIIVSCVRSNNNQGIGFLSDPRRLNVALTRAKYGLVLIGNPKVLSKNLLWLHLLTHFREKGCLVEGLINRLQPSSIQLHKPRHNHRQSVATRRYINDTESITNESIKSSHLASDLFSETDADLENNIGVPMDPSNLANMFQQQFSISSNTVPSRKVERDFGNSLSERMTKYLQADEDTSDDEYDDDDVESVSTTFASQIGLY